MEEINRTPQISIVEAERQEDSIAKRADTGGTLTAQEAQLLRQQITAQRVMAGEQAFKQFRQVLQQLGLRLICVHEYDGEKTVIGHRVVA